MFKGVKAPSVAAMRVAAALLAAALSVSACGDAPRVPTSLVPASTASITGTVGALVTPAPSVTLSDQHGRGLANVWVHWVAGAGRVVNDSSQTDANGLAASGGWTLGQTAGAQTLTASVNSVPAIVITADARPGLPAILTALNDVQGGAVNTIVATPPSVRVLDAFGNAVPNAAVLFAVSAGAGSITGAEQVANASGVATVGSWKFGTLAGTQSLRADVTATGATTMLSAIATAGAPVTIVAYDGDAQTGSINKRLCTSPRVVVRDMYGNGVGQISVSFTPVAGSGTASAGSVITDASTGFATLPAWVLGTAATQSLVVTTSALPGKQVVMTARVVPEPGFGICARFIGDGGTPHQREAVTKAVARWQQVIVGHVQTARLYAPANECVEGIPAINEDVEDLLLFVQLSPIDGAAGILGQAAPCYVHRPSALTLMGFLQLDVADLDVLDAKGTLENVVLHEIGHILGIGTLWGQISENVDKKLLSGRGGDDPFFMGAVGRAQFAVLNPMYGGVAVPVENCVGIPGCGIGTRDAHWRKSIFHTELMQGYAAPNMPMSRVTIGSLADLGYTVNLDAADPFSFLSALRSGGPGAAGAAMVNDIADVSVRGVEKNGARRMLRPAINPLRR